jgi:hypothetical protein
VELLGRDWLECAVPEDERARVFGYLRRLADNDAERELYFEHDVKAPDGTRRLIAWRCIGLQNASGRLVGYLSGEDITPAAPSSSRWTRHLLNEAQNANVGNFEVPADRVRRIGRRSSTASAHDPASERLSVERFIGLMHPDDRERCLSEIEPALTTREPMQ